MALSLGLLVVAGCLLGWYVPGALAAEAAYRTAPFCAGRPEPSGARECLEAVPGTVVAKEPGGGRGPRLPGLRWRPDGGTEPSWVRLEQEGALFEAVVPGDRVRVVRWRGEERAVVAGPLRQETSATPVGGHRLPYAVGLGLVPLGGVFGWVAYEWARRSAGARASWLLSVPMCCGLVLGTVGFFGPLVTDGLLDALLLSVGAAVPVLAAGAWLLRWRRARPSAPPEVLPRLPERERRFPGVVVGAVPNRAAGFGTLVAGPEGLAVAAGPEPGSARLPLPRSVAVVRVRPRAPADDRTGPAGQAGDWVVECRDGDREVLVVAAKKDLPWILGALR
ncbi:hypothetical protein [Streptomyces sp. BBFR102]|uniref:hypothetical protein n=1 Tax=Streptomyces sp. BBFR102 TaxID=3448171 RepID=UPI003F533941